MPSGKKLPQLRHAERRSKLHGLLSLETAPA